VVVAYFKILLHFVWRDKKLKNSIKKSRTWTRCELVAPRGVLFLYGGLEVDGSCSRSYPMLYFGISSIEILGSAARKRFTFLYLREGKANPWEEWLTLKSLLFFQGFVGLLCTRC